MHCKNHIITCSEAKQFIPIGSLTEKYSRDYLAGTAKLAAEGMPRRIPEPFPKAARPIIS